MLRYIPFTLFLLLAYNFVVVPQGVGILAHSLIQLPLPSDAIWVLSISDAMLIAGLLCLYIEIYKATKASAASIVDHVLSMLVFILFLVEFLIFEQAGNSVFFILMLIALVDVIAGFTVSISGARRDFSIGGNPDI